MSSSKAVLYFRVSTKGQARSGLGLEAQRDSVNRYVTGIAATVLDEFIEVESGSMSDRPELIKALRRCELTGATLIVAKLDRLSRDVEFIAQLQKSTVEFVCADMPQANSLTIGLLAVLAQHERELISTRTRDALVAAKVRGVKLGNPNLQLVANTDSANARAAHIEQARKRNAQLGSIIAEIERSAVDKLSLLEIAEILNNAGYTTSRGKSFSKTAVMRIRAACT